MTTKPKQPRRESLSAWLKRTKTQDTDFVTRSGLGLYQFLKLKQQPKRRPLRTFRYAIWRAFPDCPLAERPPEAAAPA